MVKVRIAPSPTGYLHIGTARTAFFNWLFARKNNGKFVVRIEDTDIERSDPKYEKDILNGLKWLGLEWDEFYKQSERTDIYEKYIKKLLDKGKAFRCYHTLEELEEEKKRQEEHKEPQRHICIFKSEILNSKSETNSKFQIPNSKKYIIRLAVNENSTRIIHFSDVIRGTIEYEEKLLGDISIAKDERTPLYNFAVVVDDYETEITYIIRGEDHISNTPKQILIAEALGFNLPQYAHLPLILGTDRSKLSKRHGAETVIEYKKDYLPEALLNFMGFLGYTYSKEILSKEEMAEEFELGRIHKAGAIFDIKKLNWINSQWVKKMSPQEFNEALRRAQGEISSISQKTVPMIAERLEKLSDVQNFKFLWEEPDYDASLLIWKNADKESAKKALENVKQVLSSEIEWEIFDEKYIRKELDDLANKSFGGDRGAVYWPLRVALSGQEKSPDPVQIMSVLTKEVVFNRIDKALKKL